MTRQFVNNFSCFKLIEDYEMGLDDEVEENLRDNDENKEEKEEEGKEEEEERKE